MPERSESIQKVSERELVMTRIFDAPREVVWKAWTDPELIPRWWGPERYTTTVVEMDVRPGGHWRFVQVDAEGNKFAFHGEYREVVPPERLVDTFEFEGMPGHIIVETATFAKQGQKTKVTLSALFQSSEDLEGMAQSGMQEGWIETIDRFTELLRGIRSGTRARASGGATPRGITIVRVLDVPRDVVWKAWTDPGRLKRWWGPKAFTTPVCRIDLRVGGKYIYCMRGPDGKDYWGTGVYREIVPMEKIVYTDSFADEKGNVVPASHYGMTSEIPLEMLVTVTFEDLGGKTRLTLRHEGIPAGKDADMASQGWSESIDKLAKLLEG